ncbi:MAG: ATP synthase F1 subunit gamma [Candidatus Aminicenantes bacterium]|nr:ATP synthase F1 subunit gamma [Candidatus Aminicenantes bacterium]
MPAIIDLRRRIKSVNNTQQITQAMKSVATAKFRQAQRSVLEGRPYWHNFSGLMANVSTWVGAELHPLLQKREEKKIICLVITSDKGMCGAFNSNLLLKTLSFLEDKSALSEVRLVLMGKKAVSFFRKLTFIKDRAYADQIHKLTQEDLKELAHYLMRLYVLNQTDAVYVAYNEFKSILAPKLTITKLLPLEPPDILEEGLPESELEPRSSSLLEPFFSLYIEDQINHFYHESQAAEQAARMMAMDNATKNAEELIDELRMVLNKMRQASITKELLEIITAVEALGKK